jgi:predicted GNAT superfamily acetyltransferase
VARNAHFNFNRLGVFVDEYVVNMYGTTGSELHGGLETDRLVVGWAVSVQPRQSVGGMTGNAERIAIPLDFERMLAQDPGEAARWRSMVRDAFERAISAGMVVGGFTVDRAAGVAHYILTAPA